MQVVHFALLCFALLFPAALSAQPLDIQRPTKLKSESRTAARALLGWTSEQQTNWQRMRSENHPYWQELLSQADGGDSVYANQGLQAAMVYLITGDNSYAREAWRIISRWAGRSRPGAEPTNRNVTRASFDELSKMYQWLSPVLSDQERAAYRDILDHWSDLVLDLLRSQGTSWGTRMADSDETVGHYFGLVLYALAIQEEDPARANELLNAVGQTPTDIIPVGGIDATARDRSTWRNTLADYAQKAVGGQWLESSQYNLFTAQDMLLNSHTISQFVGEDKFPEVTLLREDFAKALVHELTPDLLDSFQWGDVEEPRGLRVYHRLSLMSVLGGLTKDPEVLFMMDRLYNLPGQVGNTNFFLLADPYSPRRAPASEHEGTWHYASGRGIGYYRIGWGANDSFFGSRMANQLGVDHGLESHSDFGLYRQGEWVITRPVGYIAFQESYYANTVLISGLGPAREAQGTVAYKTGDNFAYHIGASGGHYYWEGFYNPPAEFLHEWTRSILYLRNNDGSDSVIVFDRVDADNPQNLPRFERYYNSSTYPHQDRITAAGGKKEWILHIPTNAVVFEGDTARWSTAGGQEVRLATLIADPYTRRLLDEKQLRAAGQLPGTISEGELKYQLRITRSTTAQYESFLHVIHTGGASSVTRLTSSANERAEGVLLKAGSQNTLVIFNGTEAEQLPPTPISDGRVSHDPEKLDKIGKLRLFKSSFNMNVTTDGPANVMVMDLDPEQNWGLMLNGQSSALSVESPGMATFTIPAAGTHQFRVYSTGTDTLPPGKPENLRISG